MIREICLYNIKMEGKEFMESENNYRATTTEQTNLLTDPFGLTVLSALSHKEYLPAEVVAKKSGEELKLIKEYLKFFEQEDMILCREEEGTKKYAKKAEYYSFSPELLSIIPEQIQDYIIFGLLHAMQGDYYDLIKLAKKHEDLDSALKKAGYPEPEKSLNLLMGKIHIKEEDMDEMTDYIRELFDKYDSVPEGENEEEYITFDLNFFLKPTIGKFKENIDE